MSIDPPYPRILSLMQRGSVIPVLGAGVNAGPPTGADGQVSSWHEGEHSTAPTGGDLAHHLATLSSYPEPESRHDLAKVAQYYSIVMGRTDLCRCVREVFLREYPITSLHRFLAGLQGPQLIVTVNYDDVLERAFREAGRPFDLVIHHTDSKEVAGSVLYWKWGEDKPTPIVPKRLLIDLETTTVIYKMHGTIDREDESNDSLVVTEDDYADFLAMMGKQAAIPPIFAEPFMRRHFLFLGYSLRDWNFRVVLSKIERDWRRLGGESMASWAIQRNPSIIEREFWRRRHVTIFAQTIAEFVQALSAQPVAV